MKRKWMKQFLNDDWDIFKASNEHENDYKLDKQFIDFYSMPAYDEDNSFAKLGDFWPKHKRLTRHLFSNAA